ncbi:MAG: hypothetical protein H6822_25840 [Planctomycetaceae bacterium]|nr:hypothetical protein [Planctomycetaceae bacterium]
MKSYAHFSWNTRDVGDPDRAVELVVELFRNCAHIAFPSTTKFTVSTAGFAVTNTTSLVLSGTDIQTQKSPSTGTLCGISGVSFDPLEVGPTGTSGILFGDNNDAWKQSNGGSRGSHLAGPKHDSSGLQMV